MSQYRGELTGPAELPAPLHRDETSRLRVNSDDRTVRADGSSTSHRGVPRSRTGTPLSVGFDWILTEEPKKTGDDEIDSGYEWESCCESLELFVPDEGNVVLTENIKGSKTGNVGVGAALAAGSVAAFFGAVLSAFGDTATPTEEVGQIGIEDGNDHGAFVTDTFAADTEEDVWSKDGHYGEDGGVYGKRGHVKVPGPTNRAPMVAAAPAPSILPAGTDESPRSEGVRRQNEGVPIPQAAWGPRVRGVERSDGAVAAEEGSLSDGADIGASWREGKRVAGVMGGVGGEFPAGQRVLQVGG